jgi:hypothetical protein
VDISRSCWSCSAAITVVGCRYIFLTETATNVVRVVARCATTDGGMWVGLVSDLAPRSHSRRIAHRLVGGEVALPRSGPSVYSVQVKPCVRTPSPKPDESLPYIGQSGGHHSLPLPLPTRIVCCLLRWFSRARKSTNLCFDRRTHPAAAAAVEFCGGLLNRLAGSRWEC